MIPGMNTNIIFDNQTYHVQTEDKGRMSPMVESLVYDRGTIIHSMKTSYSHLLESPTLNKIVSKLVERQHKQLLREIQAGKITTGLSSSLELSNIKGMFHVPESTIHPPENGPNGGNLNSESQLTIKHDHHKEQHITDRKTEMPANVSVDTGPIRLKYVSGTRIQESKFLQKLRLKTESTGSGTTIAHGGLPKVDLKAEVELALHEIVKFSPVLSAVGLVWHPIKSFVTKNAGFSGLEEFLEVITNVLPCLVAGVSCIDGNGTITETCLVTSTLRIVIYPFLTKGILVFLAKPDISGEEIKVATDTGRERVYSIVESWLNSNSPTHSPNDLQLVREHFQGNNRG